LLQVSWHFNGYVSTDLVDHDKRHEIGAQMSNLSNQINTAIKLFIFRIDDFILLDPGDRCRYIRPPCNGLLHLPATVDCSACNRDTACPDVAVLSATRKRLSRCLVLLTTHSPWPARYLGYAPPDGYRLTSTAEDSTRISWTILLRNCRGTRLKTVLVYPVVMTTTKTKCAKTDIVSEQNVKLRLQQLHNYTGVVIRSDCLHARLAQLRLYRPAIGFSDDRLTTFQDKNRVRPYCTILFELDALNWYSMKLMT